MNRGDAYVVPFSFSLPFRGRVVAKRPGGEVRSGAPAVRDWRSPPGLGCASPSLPMKGRENDSARLFAACVRGGWGGRGAAGPRPVLCMFYRFDEADLPRAAVFHAPSGWRPLLRALPDLRRRHCWLRRAADMRQRSAQEARGEQAEGHPSTSARTPEVSFPRASSLDHSPPTSGSLDPTPSPPTGWEESGMGPSYGGLVTL